MINCELCGSEQVCGTTLVEGVALKTCKTCGRFGRSIEEQTVPKSGYSNPKYKQVKEEEGPQESVVAGYGDKIRTARNKLNLSQSDFAKKINEKESLLTKVEANKLEPTIQLARKIERALGIRLVYVEETQKTIKKSAESDSITVGDLIKTKTRTQ